MSVVLLDAYNLLFRSFTSLPPAITARDGRPINAVYGTLAFVLRLLAEMETKHLVAAFDVPQTPTFRQRLYPQYQAHRGPLGGEDADEFARQVVIAQDLLPRIGIPAVALPGYEADDVMGTLATTVARSGARAVLVSTDKDLLQLVGDGIEVMSPAKGVAVIRTPEEVRTRIGVLPPAVPTFKALAGDSSDNIPGLPGIGTKTATKLIEQMETLETMYERLDELPERTRAVLESNRERAYVFRDVATIRTDLALPLDISTLPSRTIAKDDRVRSVLDRYFEPHEPAHVSP